MSADDPTALALIVDGLKRIEEKVDGVQTAMAGKADKTDVAEFQGELRGLGTRVTALERKNDLREAKAEVHRERDDRSWFSRTNKWKIVGGIIASLTGVAIAAASVVGVILQLSH